MPSGTPAGQACAAGAVSNDLGGVLEQAAKDKPTASAEAQQGAQRGAQRRTRLSLGLNEVMTEISLAKRGKGLLTH